MAKNKKIPACVDVPGRTVSWIQNGSRMYGETVKSYVQMYKPEKPLYDKQRFMRSRIVVITNDGRFFDLDASQENLKKIKMVAE